MALSLNGTSNGSLNNLSLTTNTGTVVDTSVNPFLAYDTWYLTANDTTVGSHQVDGWTRDTTSNITQIGSAMSESSSVWTFPSTGYWQIIWKPFFSCNGTDQIATSISITTDNLSTNTTVASLVATGNIGDGYLTYLFDVEDTSTHKFRFLASSIGSGSNLYGGAANRTTAIFMKLGET